MKYCNYCGSPLEDDAAFCVKCGAKLSDGPKGEGATEPEQVNKQSFVDRVFTKEFWNLKTVIAVVGVVLGVTAMIVVLAVAIRSCSTHIPQPNPPTTTQTPVDTHKPFSEVTVKIDPDSIKISIEKVLKISTLNVVKVPYSGIVDWKVGDDDVGKVRFEGEIKLGVDFDKIEVSEEKDGIIIITVPAVAITYQDTDKLSYILMFSSSKMKRNYNKDSYTADLYKKCAEKMETDVKNNQDIIDLASEYVKQFILGLTEPIVEEKGYSIKIEVAEK